MSNYMETFIVVFACIVILLIGAMRKRLEWLLNVVMRSVLGAITIYFVNLALDGVGISLGVGINVTTVLTCGILGIPGLLALYGIGIYQLL